MQLRTLALPILAVLMVALGLLGYSNLLAHRTIPESVSQAITRTQGFVETVVEKGVGAVVDQAEEQSIKRAKWNDADGIEHEVVTPRRKLENGEDEPVNEWRDRHIEEVLAMKKAFPPA